MLFSLSEKTLSTLMFLHKKDSGVGKFRADNDFIPSLLRDFGPPLTFPDSLKDDEDTKKELAGWEEDLLTCKKALAKRVSRQAERNLKAWQKEL